MREPRAFPTWLPPLIREQAHVLRSELLKSGTSDDIAVLDRMTSDPRMEAVWKFLQKHKRAGYRKLADYQHAVYDPMAHSAVNRSSFPTRAVWLQQLAMREFYTDIVRWARAYVAPASPHFYYHPRADALRAEASFVERDPFGLSAETKRKLAKDLRRTADTYARAAKEARTKTSEEAPRYMMWLVAMWLHQLFGKWMYGQAATVASLILRRKVTSKMVRKAVVACRTMP